MGKKNIIKRFLKFYFEKPVKIKFALGTAIFEEEIPPPSLKTLDPNLKEYVVDICQASFVSRGWDANFCEREFVEKGFAEWVEEAKTAAEIQAEHDLGKK